ncbi:MAG: hypothetical protein ACJ790_19740, partial [Myxococcaceae bacterium]
ATNPKPVFRVISPTTCGPITHFGCQAYVVIVADPWFNSIARNSDDDGCTVEGTETVIANPTSFGSGIRLTYPAATTLTYSLCDAHDPNTVPPTPPYSPPSPFTATANCKFTASQLSDLKYALAFPAGCGTVE